MRITRRFEWDSGHRVWGHEGKCQFLHGHRYVAEVEVEAEELDPLGRLIDFSVLKRKVGAWIDGNLDHNFLHHPDDPIAKLGWDLRTTTFQMPAGNPTAENIAALLFDVATDVLKEFHIRVVHVRVYETPNCWADYDAKFPAG